MSKINILDENVSNIIAAGEVVENPASLIKELIENSLDAGSTDIKIYIDDFGRYIKISDNGEGMDRDDILMCIERHATSKIKTKEDLFSLNTYGFRGEALASIAAVSKMVISSKTEDMETGNILSLISGNIKNMQEITRNRGTDIEIKDLFFNTPARLKFMRKKNTEYSKIKDVIIKAALANPLVSFSVFFDEKLTIKTTGKKIENCIIELFGIDIFKNLIKFDYGFLGNIEILKNSKDYIFTYVNRRNVKSGIIEKAIIDGYYTKLMKDKFPFAIIFYNIDPKNIDVNVHPSKKIIKFSDERKVYSDIYNKIYETLKKEEVNFISNFNFKDDILIKKEEFKSIENKAIQYNELPENKELKKEDSLNKEEIDESLESISLNNTKEIIFNNIVSVEKQIDKPSFQPNFEYTSDNNLKNSYKIIGQLKNSYIIVEVEDGIEIFDQHIIHERLLYEELKEKIEKSEINSQELIFPLKINLDIREKDIIQENIHIFEKFGFIIEDFGDHEIIIRGVPAFDFRDNINNIFNYIIEDIKNDNITDIREKIIISMSCKGAIKAGEKLSYEEMKYLIKNIYEKGIFTCPHGRPIFIKISIDEIEKKFKRK